MGCTEKDKPTRTKQKPVAKRSDIKHTMILDTNLIFKSFVDSSGRKCLNNHLGINGSSSSSSSSSSAQITDPNPNFDNNGWGFCSETEIEVILLNNLQFLYKEAISKLVALGYGEDVALRAVLKNGNCNGGMDVMTNILQNCLAYLNSSNGSGGEGNSEVSEPVPVAADLKQFGEDSLADMVVSLQRARPQLSKGDALWCLVMCDLHVGRANILERPGSGDGNNSVGMSPGLCKFHGGWGFGNGGGSEFPVNGFFSDGSEVTLQREIEFPKQFHFTPSMKSLLKKNVAMFAAGFRANVKQVQWKLEPCPISESVGEVPTGAPLKIRVPAHQTEVPQDTNNQDVVNSVLNKLRDLNLDENMEFVADDQKDEMILSLIHQIKDMERQVKDRKEWAHQKAMQAAKKLSNDLIELKMLRMEREETQNLKKGKQTLEDSTMKKLSEMENALRKASGQVDRANAAVRRLETENAEIRAEVEASKLSASESVSTCLEVAKREKKCLKKLLAWEKQKSKLQEEIADEKKSIVDLQQQLIQIEQAQKKTEVKFRQEVKAKELALAQVEEGRRAKEATEANNKRKLEALRLKTEIDFQRHKDDLQRLEQELSRLKASVQSTEVLHPLNTLPMVMSDEVNTQEGTIERLLHELDNMEDSSEIEVNCDKICIICMRDEVSILFLPCAHQVLCANCNDGYGKKGKATCPCCRVPIDQRIHVFGANS